MPGDHAKRKAVQARPTEFSSEQFSAALGAGIDQNYWYRARHRLLARALRDVVPEGATLLDVGCGPGFTVKYLRSEGFDCHGVELAEPKLVSGAEQFVHSGISVSDTPPAISQKAQCLLYLDVIEHLEDPVKLLVQGLQRCHNAQHVIVTVPARQEIWTHYDEYYGHYRRYTRGSLEAEATQAGLETLSVAYLFHSLYVAARAIKLLGRERPIQEKPPRYPFVPKLLATVLRAETRLLPSALPGTSVLGVFRRR